MTSIALTETVTYTQENEQFSLDRVTVFDWDDTLFPSTWLRTMGFIIKPDLKDGGITTEMTAACEEIAAHVAILLLRAKEYGKVVIITNASRSWVEKACTIFMPKIASIVLSIPIISAADLYSRYYSNPITWKKMAFRSNLLNQMFNFQNLSRKTIISIGDGFAEQVAARDLMSMTNSHVGPLLVKCLKIIPLSTPTVLIYQLIEIEKILPALVASQSTLDLEWNTIPIGGSEIKTEVATIKTITPEEKKTEEYKEAHENLYDCPPQPYIPICDSGEDVFDRTEAAMWNDFQLKSASPTQKIGGLILVTGLPPLKPKVKTGRAATPFPR